MSEPVKMPVSHFLRRDYLHIFFYIKFLVFVSLVPQINYLIPHSHQLQIQNSQKKEKKNTSQMRLRSVFKMRTSILNTATTEQMGCISFFFFRLHEIYKLVFEMKIFGREYIFDGQNMYVLYVDSVWNNDENSLLIRGKSKLNSRTRKL